MIYDSENVMMSQLLWGFAERFIPDEWLHFFLLDIPSFDLEKIWTGTTKILQSKGIDKVSYSIMKVKTLSYLSM